MQQVFPAHSLGFLWLLEEKCNTFIPKSQRSRAGIPSMRKPASREIISDSVELCETEVCFLRIELIETNVWLPNMHKSPPDVDLEYSRSPAKSESWNNPSMHCCAVLPTWHYCLNSHVWWMYEIKRAQRLSQALVHFVLARASLFGVCQCGPNARRRYFPKFFRSFSTGAFASGIIMAWGIGINLCTRL